MKESNFAIGTELIEGEACPMGGTGFALFSASAVALAAYTGTPIAGFVLMAVNYRRLEEKEFAAAALILGLVVTGLAVYCFVALPYVVSLPLCFAALVGTRLYAVRVQSEYLAQHVSRGGRLGSRWVALGVGITCLGTLLLAGWATVHLAGWSGR